MHLVVISTSEKISVQAGTYDCYHYKSFMVDTINNYIDSSTIIHDYYCPNLGLIASYKYINNQYTMVSELIKIFK